MSSVSPDSTDALAHRAVFLSYAREDTAAAQRIADALRSQGVEVWFDQSELRGGDVWDKTIRRQIKECALFVPIISGRTQARGEGYFRLEWKLAVERTHLMAEGVPFLVPVVVDETPEGAAIVPAEFLRVQWIRLPGALPTPQFVGQIRRMMDSPGSAPVSAQRTATGAVPRPAGNRALVIVAIAAVLVAAIAAVVVMKRPAAPAAAPAVVTVAAPAVAQAAPPADAVDPKSVAVLPFENMSEDKQNAFFSDGVHEDVLTNLSFIKDLHVISRTSVMQYRDTTKSIKQIGRELGVAYVLEGSVRREGNKVRVTGQLIDARTDEHVWAKAYDRDLNDIFAIQGELAQAIADALKSVLSPETKVLLARRPTENTEAYDYYLKSRHLRSSAILGIQDSQVGLLEKAVRLDPSFAQAWAELGSVRAFAYFGDVRTQDQLRLAKEAIDSAVRIAPDDPAVIEGLGDYYYYGYRDYARATEQYMRLEQLRPNDAVVYYSLGLIQRRQGRFADALSNMRRGISLDPTNHQYITTMLETMVNVHLYDETLGIGRKFCEANPQDVEAAWGYSQGAYMATGSTVEMTAFAKRTVAEEDRNLFIYLRELNAGTSGDWAEFVRINREQRYFDGNTQDAHWSQDASAAEVFAESGDIAAARTRASEAVAQMKDAMARQPNNADLWANLALAQGILGERENAVASVQKSAELLPESRDAINGPADAAICALALAWAGEKERSLSELKRLFHVPFGANVNFARVSFGPLQGDPRFKEMVSDPANNAPLL